LSTPFDAVIDAIKSAGYHNHRREGHSDIVSDGIFDDLMRTCDVFRADVDAEKVKVWKNVPSPGDRGRKIDLFVGEPDGAGEPVMAKCRLAIENKSVITAHRNGAARFDDLTKVVGAIQGERPEAVVIATVLIGLALRYLNVPDGVRPLSEDRGLDFDRDVLPRLSSGDETLFDDFKRAISTNGSSQPAKTVELFRTLDLRGTAQTHLVAYDSVLLVPVMIDNVHPATLPRPNPLGIDVDAEYADFLDRTCKAYTARWHM
jgi:hypothetical protein